MSYKGRELEVKLVAEGVHLTEVHRLLTSVLDIRKAVYDTSTDTYWPLPETVRGDFARMRELSAGTIQVTVKARDRGSNLDRLERELETESSAATVRGILTAALGPAAGRVTKTYHVYWLAGEGEHTTVSCYTVAGHEDDGVYIELESSSKDRVLGLVAQVREAGAREDLYLQQAAGSLWELYLSSGEGV